jgi:homoprotocatechuate degradation regulator HpaR
MTAPPPTARSLPIALLRAREAVMAGFRPLLSAHDVTEAQWRVLRVLDEAGPLDATDLAARASVLPPSLTRMLRALAARGFLARGGVDGDGRRLRIAITDEGRAFVAALAPDSAAIHARIAADFGAARTEALLALLDDLARLRL